MLTIEFTRQFKKDFKKYEYKQETVDLLYEILSCLQSEEQLPAKVRDHALSGNYKGSRECHVKPDVLLVYHIANQSLILERIGSHSELF